jgi:hypothetical protein
MKAAKVAFLALALFLPATAISTPICDRYQEQLRGLVGEGQITLSPVMSRPGSRDERPPQEIGCKAYAQSSGRGATLHISRVKQDAGDAVRSTKNSFINAGMKSAPMREPTLGREGFSFLTSLASANTLNYLVVIGHGTGVAAQVEVLQGRSQGT